MYLLDLVHILEETGSMCNKIAKNRKFLTEQNEILGHINNVKNNYFNLKL